MLIIIIALWLLISAVALVVDILTSNIFFVFFSVGGILAFVADLCGLSLWIQAIIFLGTSILLILTIYPYVQKNLKRTVPPFLAFEKKYIGEHFIAPVDLDEEGLVQIGGIYWTVKNAGSPIKKGDVVEVIGIDGNKFLIKKLEGDKT